MELTHEQLKQTVGKLNTLTSNHRAELDRVKTLDHTVYAEDYIQREKDRVNAEYKEKYIKFSKEISASILSAKTFIEAAVQKAKPADYELKLSNMLAQLQQLSAPQMKEMGAGLIDRLSVFKDDPLARNAISSIVKAKDTYLAAGLFDLTVDRQLQQLTKADEFILGTFDAMSRARATDDLYYTVCQAGIALDVLLKGTLYDVEKPKPMTDEVRATLTAEIRAGILGNKQTA